MNKDENGWRIPRIGTKSRTIYDLTRKGLRPRDIEAALGIKTVRQLLFRIRNPAVHNATALAEYRAKK